MVKRFYPKPVLVDPDTHRALKILAAQESTSIGKIIKKQFLK